MRKLYKSIILLVSIIVLLGNSCYSFAHSNSGIDKDPYRMWNLLFGESGTRNYYSARDISIGFAYFELLYPQSDVDTKVKLEKWMDNFTQKSFASAHLGSFPNVSDNLVEMVKQSFGQESVAYSTILFLATQPYVYCLKGFLNGSPDIAITTNEKQEQYYKEFIGMCSINNLVDFSFFLLQYVHNLPYPMVEDLYHKILTSKEIQQEKYDIVYDRIILLCHDHIFPSSKLATVDLSKPIKEQPQLTNLYNLARDRTSNRFGVCSSQLIDLISRLSLQSYLYDDKEMVNTVYLVLEHPTSTNLDEDSFNKVMNAGLKAFDRIVARAEKWDYSKRSPLDLLKKKKTYLISHDYGKDSSKFKEFVVSDVVSRFGEYSEEYDIIVNQ